MKMRRCGSFTFDASYPNMSQPVCQSELAPRLRETNEDVSSDSEAPSDSVLRTPHTCTTYNKKTHTPAIYGGDNPLVTSYM